MSKELVIGANRHETKVAIVEDDQLVEVYFQRANEYSLAGSIHKGRVTRVLPGMQSAFVDLGLERDTFLYVSDFFEENEDIEALADDKPAREDRRERPDRSPDRGQNRSAEKTGEQRRPEVQEQRLATPPAIVFRPPVPLEVTIESISAVGQSEPGTENRGGERAENDREVRGDRRGRRPRRRRPRGGGFPETKYAHPSESSVPREATAAIREAPAAMREAPAAMREALGKVSQEEVIVLPGESLAKYKHVSDSVQPLASAGQHPSEFVKESLRAEIESASGDGLETELEAEAEEIELADRIFSHGDLSVDAEEEKIEEIKRDQPESGFLVDDLETEESEPGLSGSGISSAESSTAMASGSGLAEFGAKRESTLFSTSSLAESIYVDTEISALDDEELESPSVSSELLQRREFEPDEATASPTTAIILEQSAASAVDRPPVETAPSATVREQGDRFMHRTSRRMRRRRGGSRFPQEGSSSESTPEFASGIAAAPAAAIQPISRNEPKRDVDEEPPPQRPDRVMPSISDLLKPGQEIIVQIAKEPLGQKGARITSHVALPGRYVVFMPSVHHLGVSRKVGSDEERQRLKRILQTHRVGTTGGFIVRTAGEGVPEEEIAADMNFLYSLWLDIRQKAEKKPAPALLHYDLDIVQRILRDQVTEEFKAIWVDNEEMYESVLTFLQRFQPALVSRVKMYTRQAPIFDAFNITQELEKALRPKVWLKSGGYIVINQTEALVAIDINTGKFVGKSNRLEDTIVKTNTEAVKEIVRQIRLRDLGGIIVVDFIDMDERKNRQKVMQALEEAMQVDKAPYKILQFNDFGLVAITRKRVKQSLERTLCAPCPHCEGAGYVKSVQTVIGEILAEAQKIARAIDGKDVVLRVNPEVAKVLKASSNRFLEEMEEVLGRPVLVASDASLHSEKFDLA